jgi:hypothetical protein
MPPASRFALAFTLGAALACSPSPKVPDAAQILCAADGDCPEGWYCHPFAKRCSTDHGPGTPPAALTGTVQVTPAVAGATREITIAFDVDRDLAFAPTVVLAAAQRRNLSLVSAVGRHYVFSTVALPSDGEGTWNLIGTLVDTQGRLALEVALAAVTLDFSPPVVMSASRVGGAADLRAGAAVVVELVFSEPIPVAPEVQLADGAVLSATSTADSAVWRFRHVATGGEAEGTAPLSVRAVDAAGNAGTRGLGGVFSFDFTEPALAGTAVVETPWVRMGQAATVAFTASERTGPDPAVVLSCATALAPLPMGVAQQVGDAWTFFYPVRIGAPSGACEVWLTHLEDPAGNVGAETLLGALSIDLAAPAAVGAVVPTKLPASYRAGERIAVDLVLDEELAGPPVAWLDGSPPLAMDCAPGAATWSWRCTLAAPLTGSERQGAANVRLAFGDRAGNEASALAPVTLDFTSPSPLSLSRVGGSAHLRVGAEAVVEVVFSEPIAAPPEVLLADGAVLAATTTADPAVWRLRHVATGAEAEGLAPLSVRAVDAAGNAAIRPLAGVFSFDFTDPALAASAVIETPFVQMGQAATVGFTATEPAGLDPTVVLSCAAGTGPLAMGVGQQAGNSWTFFYPVRAGAPEGACEVWLEHLEDLAGNVGPEVHLGTLSIDFTAPAVVGAVSTTKSPPVYRAGEQLAVDLLLDEELSAPPVAWVDTVPNLPLDCAPGASSLAWRCTLAAPLAGTEAQGPAKVWLTFSDRAGNGADASTPVTLDFLAPALASARRIGPSVPLAAGRTGELELVLDELPAIAPTARLAAGQGVTVSAGADARTWRLQYQAAGTEAQGPSPVEVDVVDAAGNQRLITIDQLLAFDFTAPVLLDVPAPTVAPAHLTAGQNVVATATFSEPLDPPPVAELVPLAGGPVLSMTAAAAGASWTFGRQIAFLDAQGVYDVRVRALVDPAGNVTTAVYALGTTTIDNSAPTLALLPAPTKSPPIYRVGERVEVSLTLDEDLAELPTAWLVTLTTTVTLDCRAGATAREFLCAMRDPLDGTERPEGPVEVDVKMRDLAGNVLAATTSVVLDFTPPTLLAGSESLVYLQPPLGFTVAMRSLVPNGGAEVRFTASETLSAAPVLEPVPAAFAPSLVTSAGNTYLFSYAPGATTPPDGTYDLRTWLVDEAGNGAWVTLGLPPPAFLVRSAAPAAPDTSALTLARAPWGTAFPEPALAGTLAPSMLHLVLDGPELTAHEVARFTTDGLGAFSLATLGTDVAAVWLVAVDDVGVTSNPPIPVRDVRWTVQVAGAPASTFVPNPSTFDTRTWSTGALRQADSQLPASSALWFLDGFAVVTEEGGTMGRLDGTSTAPAGPAAFDSTRGITVAFPGTLAEGAAEWNGFHWRTRTSTSVPDPAEGISAAAFDPVASYVLAVGRDRGATYAWDESGWTVLAEPALSPPPRWDAALAIDPVRGSALLVGGRDPYMEGTPTLGDAWSWNGTDWISEPAAAISPSSTHALVFDLARDRYVLIGGCADGIAAREWVAGAWATVVPLDPEGDGDPVVDCVPVRAAYDARRGVTLVQVSSQTWAWNGASFRLLATAAGAGDAQAFALDALRDRAVMVAGDRTWEWDRAEWVPLFANTTFQPYPAVGGTWRPLAFDTRARTVETFVESSLGGALEVWRWGSAGWQITQIPDTGHIGYISTAHDGDRGVTVVFGTDAVSGQSATWEWDGTSLTTVALGGPVGRQGAAMGYDPDPAHSVVVLFGGFPVIGNADGNVWEWTYDPATGSRSWQQIVPVGGPAPGNTLSFYSRTSFVWDAYRRELLLDDGSTTWAWNGSRWLDLARGLPPGQAVSPGLVNVIPERGWIVYGLNSWLGLSRYWAWNGVGWLPLTNADPESDGVGYAEGVLSAWVPGLGRLVTLEPFGGATYAWDPGGHAGPSHVVQLAYPSSGGPDAGACRAGACQISSIDVNWTAGGDGAWDVATPRSGARLEVWELGAWRPLVENGAPSSAPGELRATIADPAQLGRIFTSRNRTLSFAARPFPGDGLDLARVATDHVEITVRYRLP